MNDKPSAEFSWLEAVLLMLDADVDGHAGSLVADLY